ILKLNFENYILDLIKRIACLDSSNQDYGLIGDVIIEANSIIHIDINRLSSLSQAKHILSSDQIVIPILRHSNKNSDLSSLLNFNPAVNSIWDQLTQPVQSELDHLAFIKLFAFAYINDDRLESIRIACIWPNLTVRVRSISNIPLIHKTKTKEQIPVGFLSLDKSSCALLVENEFLSSLQHDYPTCGLWLSEKYLLNDFKLWALSSRFALSSLGSQFNIGRSPFDLHPSDFILISFTSPDAYICHQVRVGNSQKCSTSSTKNVATLSKPPKSMLQVKDVGFGLSCGQGFFDAFNATSRSSIDKFSITLDLRQCSNYSDGFFRTCYSVLCKCVSSLETSVPTLESELPTTILKKKTKENIPLDSSDSVPRAKPAPAQQLDNEQSEQIAKLEKMISTLLAMQASPQVQKVEAGVNTTIIERAHSPTKRDESIQCKISQIHSELLRLSEGKQETRPFSFSVSSLDPSNLSSDATCFSPDLEGPILSPAKDYKKLDQDFFRRIAEELQANNKQHNHSVDSNFVGVQSILQQAQLEKYLPTDSKFVPDYSIFNGLSAETTNNLSRLLVGELLIPSETVFYFNPDPRNQ
ncbi:hypothetical protein Ciccas_012252, partial [Cichlidogyrus casuarinus]